MIEPKAAPDGELASRGNKNVMANLISSKPIAANSVPLHKAQRSNLRLGKTQNIHKNIKKLAAKEILKAISVKAGANQAISASPNASSTRV